MASSETHNGRERSNLTNPTPTTPDAVPGNWVAKTPTTVRPYLRLMRADRPIGTWLLLIPCWWGQSLAAAQGLGALDQHLFYAVLFAIGAFVMRGAGCTYNDIVDQGYDAKVERTALRPIPAGEVSTRQAWAFLVAQCLIGLLVLAQFNRFTIMLGVGSLALVAAYPFMKRITWWPQAWLGLTFNWGALVGYAAITGGLSTPAVILYAAGFFWTLGYDTIYAHQDTEDDALIGVKSTALKFGEGTRPWLIFFYAMTMAGFIAAGLLASFSPLYFILLAPPAIHLFGQIQDLDIRDSHNCLTIFKRNRKAGVSLVTALICEAVFQLF